MASIIADFFLKSNWLYSKKSVKDKLNFMDGILALDQGTTSSRALFVDQKGKIQVIHAKDFTQYFPEVGWVEHDAEEIFSKQIEAAKNLLLEGDFNPRAIGITNQRETTVVWDRKTSKPICRAIVWQDRRTAPFCQKLNDKKLREMVQKKTGLLIDPYFSGTKVKWILDHVKGAKEKAQAGELAFGTIDSWLIWKLTKGKVHVTDHTNASRTLLFNIVERKWDGELLDLFQIPRSMLPEVKSSSEVYGNTDVDFFGKEIPIAGCAGDQQAALFGQCCFEQGAAKNTYGTGCFLLLNIGKKPLFSKKHLITTIGISFRNEIHYAFEGSVFIAGAAIKWLKDSLNMIEDASEMDQLAMSVQDTHGVVFVPALTGLGAPYWRPEVRGSIFGLTRGTTKAHIARATLEAIAMRSMDVLEAMCSEDHFSMTHLKVDGGVTNSEFLMQFQADVLGIPIIKPQNIEVTALGAAFLAGLAVGFWKDLEEIKSMQMGGEKYHPKIQADKIGLSRKKWKKAIETAKKFSDES